MLSNQLSKVYDPSAVETRAYQAWQQARAFHAEPADGGPPYSIVIPPPNVTAALHLGHALNNTLQDILIRWQRMMGKNTCWLPGTDHAGIATQTIVDKRLQIEGQPALKEYKQMEARGENGRSQFLEKVYAWKDEYEKRITEQLKVMGCSCDWDRQAFTMDEPRAKAVREAFFRLFQDGLIYRGKRLVNWDPVSQTALADDEVEMEEVDGNFYYLRYPLVQDGSAASGITHVTVATTRPETMLGDTAVAINPKDPRAAQLRGRKVLLPIVNRQIPIIEDDYVVLPVSLGGDENDAKAQFATGFLKVTPAHDPNDYEIGQRHGLAMINIMASDASISNKHGWEDVGDGAFVLGQSREAARKLVVDWFKQNGLLEEIKPYRHSVGHSYRSHVPVEPYLSDQWYCRVTDPRLAGAALGAMARDQVEETDAFVPESSASVAGAALRFYPARYAKTFQTWHENIRDWCISRQLWWGHRIPVWARVKTELSPQERQWLTQELIPQLRQWKQDNRVAFDQQVDVENATSFFICVRREDDQPIIQALEKFGLFVQDSDVLDTWFSSALWPMSTLNWPDADAIENKQSALNVWNPTSVLCTAREIITLWVSRMVMFNLYLLNRLPFTDVFIHAMIQDGHGQKMSKSLGNGVDPVDIILSHGADAMRFTLASMATNTQDVRLPVDMVDPHSGETFTPEYVTDSAGYKVAKPIQSSPKNPKQKMVSSYGVASGKAHPTPDMPAARNTSSKFDLGRNFCNKLWNAARFVIASVQGASSPANHAPTPAASAKDNLADRWIISRLARAVAAAQTGLRDYRFDQYAQACYDFFWRDYCDWYVEASKAAMKDPATAEATAQVLVSVLDGALRLMHPMIPFITETIWWNLNEIAPQRGLAGLTLAPSELLIKAAWPQPAEPDESAEADFARLQEIITAIRNIRNEYKVEPRKGVTVSLKADGKAAELIRANRAMVELLGTCSINQIEADLKQPVNSARALAAEMEIYIEDLIDPAAEQQRIEKKRQELAGKISAMKGRLSNQAYTAKAPAHLVQQTRDQLAAAEAELQKLG